MNQELEKIINAIKVLLEENVVGQIWINLKEPIVTDQNDFEEIRKQFGIPEFYMTDSISFVFGTWKWYMLDTHTHSINLSIKYEYSNGKIKIEEIELRSYPKR